MHLVFVVQKYYYCSSILLSYIFSLDHDSMDYKLFFNFFSLFSPSFFYLVKQRQFLPRSHVFIQKKASFISSKLFLIKLYVYIIIIIHSFYIALFSALEQTQYSHVACDSEWVTVSFYTIACIINLHGSGVLVALCGCCMAGATWNAAVSVQVLCTPFNHAPRYSVTSFKAT